MRSETLAFNLEIPSNKKKLLYENRYRGNSVGEKKNSHGKNSVPNFRTIFFLLGWEHILSRPSLGLLNFTSTKIPNTGKILPALLTPGHAPCAITGTPVQVAKHWLLYVWPLLPQTGANVLGQEEQEAVEQGGKQCTDGTRHFHKTLYSTSIVQCSKKTQPKGPGIVLKCKKGI